MYNLKCQTCRYVVLSNTEKPVCRKYMLFTNDARTSHFCGKEAKDWQPKKAHDDVSFIDQKQDNIKTIKFKVPPSLWFYQ